MEIGIRLRELRVEREMSQGDVEKKTGLLRCYISRVEKGHTVPSVDTLEKLARAFEIPMYRLFLMGDEKAKVPAASKVSPLTDEWGSKAKDAELLKELYLALNKLSDKHRNAILVFAAKMARE